MNFLRKMFKSIGRTLRKIWATIKKVIAIILVAILIIALCYTGMIWMLGLPFSYTTAILGLTVAQLLMLGVGGVILSYLVMPDTTSWAVRRAFDALRLVTSEVVETAGDIAGDVVEQIGNVVGRAASSSGGLLLIAAVGALALTGSSGGKTTIIQKGAPA